MNLLPVPAWTEEAACARVDGELWYPDVGSNPNMAKRICQGCPSKVPCLQWALDNNETYGVWGATTAMERRRMKKVAA